MAQEWSRATTGDGQRFVFAETGAEGPKGMGLVMKALNPKIAGRAEGGRVAAAVKSALS